MTKTELVDIIKAFRESATDEVALQGTELFPLWTIDTKYEVGTRVVYNNILYKCLQAHTSQSTWTPTDAVSLWTKVLIPSPSITPNWEQPNSTNPYMKGDKVKHKGKTWECVIDNNVWEPGVHGWNEINEE